MQNRVQVVSPEQAVVFIKGCARPTPRSPPAEIQTALYKNNHTLLTCGSRLAFVSNTYGKVDPPIAPYRPHEKPARAGIEAYMSFTQGRRRNTISMSTLLSAGTWKDPLGIQVRAQRRAIIRPPMARLGYFSMRGFPPSGPPWPAAADRIYWTVWVAFASFLRWWGFAWAGVFCIGCLGCVCCLSVFSSGLPFLWLGEFLG